jgi:hypothetical protein
MIRSLLIAGFFLLLSATGLLAQEYQVSKLDSPAPPDAVAPPIAARLQPTGLKVTKGSQTVIEIWLAKEWPVAADAKTGGEILYPLSPGELFAVARYARKGADFRDQNIPAGTYVVRYAHQPIDGAHVGTSPTRDFLALLPAAKDREPQTLDYKTLVATSKQTTGTEHPAILSLQPADPAAGELSVREDADRGWVIVHFVGKTKQGGTTKDLPMDVVVVGKTAE